MVAKRKELEQVKEENKVRKENTPLGQINLLLQKCHSNELIRIMKDIKHTHLKNAVEKENKKEEPQK